MVNSCYDMVFNNRPLFILWFTDYLGYFILGYLIKDYKSKISSMALLMLYFTTGCLIAIRSYYSIKYLGNLYFYGYLTPFVIVGSLSIFTLFQQINMKSNILSGI